LSERADPGIGAARLICGIAAIGAGLIHLATAIGSPPAIAAVVAMVGVAEFGWGVVAVVARGIPLPTAARVGAVVPIVLWVLVLLVAGPAQLGPFTSTLRLGPMLAASALDLTVVVGVTIAHRRAIAGGARRTGRGAIVATVIGGLAIAALTAAALTATEAGEQARNGTGFFSGHDH
jgi:hypothetical protein